MQHRQWNSKQPPLGVTIFTHSIFTVTLTVIVIWPQWEWVNFQPSEAVKVLALPLYVTRRTPLIFQSYVFGSNYKIMEWYLWKIRCEVCACAGSYQLVDEPLDKTDTLCATERKYLLGPFNVSLNHVLTFVYSLLAILARLLCDLHLL